VSAIVADGLTKWYGARLAIDRVSFDVAPGEVMGLLGPNGSGKTTVLRILTGFLRPSSGTARVAGIDITESPLAARQRIGYVPEDVPLYEWMRVREFLEFMARIKHVAVSGHGAVDEVVDRLALRDVLRVPIGKLSRGFRQRVAIAQALVNDPPVLVLDEPTNGLDPRQIAEMRALIRSLAGSHTILVTSHVLAEVERVADRAAILVGGRLLAVHALARGAPGTRMRVVARAPADLLLARVQDVPGVKDVEITGAAHDSGAIICLVEMEPGVGESLAAALVARGVTVLEIGEARPDLEAVFLAVTGAGAGRAP
jgi:gliding motility-associated transport system ATP-binding protein